MSLGARDPQVPAHADSVESTVWQALRSNTSQRALWFSALFSVIAFVLAYAGCLVLNHRASALAAGLVAMFAVTGAGVVPRGLTLQVGIPTGICVVATVPLVLLCDGRPVVAAALTATVLGLGALSQADHPIGSVAGVMASLAFILGVAARTIHSAPLSESLFASVIGAVSAAICVAGLMAWRWYGWHRHVSFAVPKVPRIPGSAWQRWSAAVRSALHDWRHDPDVRLAVRRIVVLAPLAAALQAYGNPSITYALLAAYAVTQPTMRETTSRTIAQVAGATLACLLAVLVGLLVQGLALVAVGLIGMAIGLAFVERNRFIAAAGTTAFALAGASMSAAITDVAAGRLGTTLAGAAIGVVATLVIRPPRAAGTPGQNPISE